MDLKGKTILITGASRGIGRATAILAGSMGARIAINYEKQSKLAEEAAEFVRRAGGQAVTIRGDVSVSADAEKIVGETVKKFGALDVLINNAGIVSWKLMTDENIGYLQRMVDVNFNGVVNMTYAAIPIMRKQKTGGVIVNIASGAGKTGYPHLAVYSATKFAVIGFTQGIGKELVEKHIRVYAVCPGMTATDMTGYSGMPPEKVAQRILEAATEKLGLQPGEDTEIYQ